MKHFGNAQGGLSLKYPALFAALIATGALTATAHARSLQEIQATNELRICLVAVPGGFQAEPPDCRENCTFSGDIYELASAFSHSLGSDLKPVVRRVDWDQQFFDADGQTVRDGSYTPELLASGTCDVYATGMTRLPWRERKLAFVTTYPTRMMVVTNKSRAAQFRGPADVCGKTAATVKDTSYHTWMQEQNQAACAANPIQIELMTFEESARAVDAGRADFMLDNFDSTMWVGSPFKNSIAVFPVGPRVEQGWAFRKEDRELQAAAEKFFETQKAERDSLLNEQWKSAVGMSLPEYLERVPQ